MPEETYSARMLEALRLTMQQASLERLAELVPYYNVRGGPGRDLVAAELHRRLARRQANYQKPAA